ncbi:MAG TPA: hypothetical protein VLF39_00960 [Candidatus Saccharimonadales bacterium]|nr:hypothetical protein [Candidatus Saccharimonadales bacterium]
MKSTNHSDLHVGLIRATRAHFVYILAVIIQIIAYDAAKLITPQAVFRRWVSTAVFLTIVVIIWFMARTRIRTVGVYKLLLLTLILADISFASYQVYTQRGMASRAVVLYLIPIVVSAIAASRTAIFGTAALSIAAYTSTTVAYFYFNFNEGYKVELYGEVGFYSAMFLVIASLVWLLARSKRHR